MVRSDWSYHNRQLNESTKMKTSVRIGAFEIDDGEYTVNRRVIER